MRRFRTLKVPERTHPLVKRLYAEMNNQRIGVHDLAERAGVDRNTITAWKYTQSPGVAALDACFQVMGLELSVRYAGG